MRDQMPVVEHRGFQIHFIEHMEKWCQSDHNLTFKSIKKVKAELDKILDKTQPLMKAVRLVGGTRTVDLLSWGDGKEVVIKSGDFPWTLQVPIRELREHDPKVMARIAEIGRQIRGLVDERDSLINSLNPLTAPSKEKIDA